MDEPPEKFHSLSKRPENRPYNPAYTRFIRWMRLILPLLAVAIIVALFVWNTRPENGIVPESEMPKRPKHAKNELLNPRFESTDKKNRLYTITAIRATQASEDDKLILLEEPRGQLHLESNNTLYLDAHEGAYHQEKETMFLSGNVQLRDKEGYEINTQSARIDLNTAQAWSDDPVSGHGPMGTLNAQSFRISNNGDLLVFHGPAKLTLNKEVL